MAPWNPNQYLRFEADRRRPCLDLAAALTLDAPARIADLGCGPGNSTEVLLRRFPAADIVGVDRSTAMLDAARQRLPALRFEAGDLSTWASSEPIDLLFSNAALHWLPDQERVLPRLFEQVRPGGALAFQVPHNLDAPGQVAMRDVANSPAFERHFQGLTETWYMRAPGVYYDLLSPHAQRVDLWLTEYHHVLSGPDEIVEWYKGSSLPKLLDRLPDDDERAAYLSAYQARIRELYPVQRDGRVLFPFRRLFCVAYRV